MMHEEISMINPININDRISYIKATDIPLSADVGIIKGDSNIYFFDVGSNNRVCDYINSVNGKKTVIISHFHRDHSENIKNIVFDRLLVGKETYRHIGIGEVIETDLSINDGILLEVMHIPNSHCKGSLILNIDRKYTLIGDSIYASSAKGVRMYNAGVLKAQLEIFRGLKTDYFLVSHKDKFIYTKKNILDFLDEIYSKRDKNSSYIIME